VPKRSKAQPRNCKQCGELFYAREANEGVYCSRECHRLGQVKPKPPRPVYSCAWCDETEVHRKGGCCSDGCRKAKAAARERARNKAKSHKQEATCRECKALFVSPYGVKRRLFCCESCADSYTSRLQHADKDAKKRSYTVIERFDPFEVFEKYDWRCYICRRPTPRELRGSNDNREPTLDHIKPVTLGGVHSKANAACACRECNASKDRHARYGFRTFKYFAGLALGKRR
jgi:hypothetical protein